MKKHLTVILPCAGLGSRLSLPFSKELFAVEWGVSLIDLSISHFLNQTREQVSFVITITEDKTDIVRYLAKYKNKFNFLFTYFNPSFNDFPGSIKSARVAAGDYNLILLPDSKIELNDGENLYEMVIKKFDNSESFLICSKTQDDLYKSKKGCILIDEDSHIIDYEDKPQNTQKFNSVWCGIGTTLSAWTSIENFITAGTFKTIDFKDIFKASSLYGSEPLIAKKFTDLGTWEDLRYYLK